MSSENPTAFKACSLLSTWGILRAFPQKRISGSLQHGMPPRESTRLFKSSVPMTHYLATIMPCRRARLISPLHFGLCVCVWKRAWENWCHHSPVDLELMKPNCNSEGVLHSQGTSQQPVSCAKQLSWIGLLREHTFWLCEISGVHKNTCRSLARPPGPELRVPPTNRRRGARAPQTQRSWHRAPADDEMSMDMPSR